MAAPHAPTQPIAKRANSTSPAPTREAERVQELQWKLRIAVLWMFLAVSTSAHVLLMIMTPGTIAAAIAGKLPDGSEMNAAATIEVALFWLVPFTMAFLTLTLSKAINRPANIALGLLASVMWSWDALEHLALDGVSLMTLATIIAGLLIVWHAWTWPGDRKSVV